MTRLDRDASLGLVHTPLTPFDADQKIDYALYATLLDFHLANGADALAVPMHVGESVSLSDDERVELVRFAVTHVAGRVPLIAHVSQSGTEVTAVLARRMEEAGADAVIVAAPYYWTPPEDMLLAHFARVGEAVQVPFLVYRDPGETPGVKLETSLILALQGRCENFMGVVDASLDWQFMIDVVSQARAVNPRFHLVSGSEHLVSANAIGASGAFAPHACVAPRAVRQLYELCDREAYADALPLQEQIAPLLKVFKAGGVPSVKRAMRLKGRECGRVRTPLLELTADEEALLRNRLDETEFLRDEVVGWG